jgi:ABC-type Zn2+ transport system substrate-binding protein/surface adhesin
MSDSHGHDGHEHDEHDEHDAHDHHGPPPPAEPDSPAWLPVVGIAFFVALGIWYGLRPSDPPPDAAAAAAPASEAAPVGKPSDTKPAH